MSDVIPFAFGDQLLRVIRRNGEPWFVAADVCRALGIKNHRDAIERLDDDEKGVGTSDTLGGEQQLAIVSESGMYAIVLRSQAALTPGTVAHRFRKWVTAEVLPSIRRTGAYAAPGLASRPSRAATDPVHDFLAACEGLEASPLDVTLVRRKLEVLGVTTLSELTRATQSMAAKRRRAAVAELVRGGVLRLEGYDSGGRPGLSIIDCGRGARYLAAHH